MQAWWLPNPSPAPPHAAHLCRNSWKRMRLGKPWRQMRMPSRTPLQRSWSSTSRGSSFPACKEQSQTCEVSGCHTEAPLIGWQPSGELRWMAVWAGQKWSAISSGSTYNLLSTCYVPGRNACPRELTIHWERSTIDEVRTSLTNVRSK